MLDLPSECESKKTGSPREDSLLGTGTDGWVTELYLGRGGTEQSTVSETLPSASTARSKASPWSRIWATTNLGPGCWNGVSSGDWVILTMSPLAKGPAIKALAESAT